MHKSPSGGPKRGDDARSRCPFPAGQNGGAGASLAPRQKLFSYCAITHCCVVLLGFDFQSETNEQLPFVVVASGLANVCVAAELVCVAAPSAFV